jgi:hypothetical protein
VRRDLGDAGRGPGDDSTPDDALNTFLSLRGCRVVVFLCDFFGVGLLALAQYRTGVDEKVEWPQPR